MSEMRTAVDVDTGELFYAPKPKTKVKSGWCRMFQIKLEEVAKDKDLRGMPISVYLFMISKVDYDNICRFPQILIAEELNTTAQYISKSIKLLKTKKIITEVKQKGTLVKAYSFNTKYIVKGKQDKKTGIVDELGDRELDQKAVVSKMETTEAVVKDSLAAQIAIKPKHVHFDRFWAIWPKKVDGKEARKVWDRLKPDEDLFNKIVNHCTMAFVDTEKKFIPGPAKYLRGEKWSDEIINQTDSKPNGFEGKSWERAGENNFQGNTFDGELN
jgi:hypothetical protein